jgi:hypothetical protein
MAADGALSEGVAPVEVPLGFVRSPEQKNLSDYWSSTRLDERLHTQPRCQLQSRHIHNHRLGLWDVASRVPVVAIHSSVQKP